MTETKANTEAYDPYPRDWGHVPLEALVIEGGLVRGPFGGSLTKASFTKQGYKVYEQRNAIYRSTELGRYYIGPAKFKELERFQVSPGEMIVSCSGTIGQIFKLPENSPKGVINQALLKIRLDPERIHDDYFLHVFRSDEFQQRIKENTHGGAMQNLVGMPIFRQTTIACPPTIQEQRAIAEALGDVDELIGSLERLIAKKRDIKQSVMQQLLTGKTRLPGFTGEWNELQLGSLGDTYGGLTGKSKQDFGSGNAQYVTFMNVMTNPVIRLDQLESVSVRASENQNRVRQGDLLFNGSSETPEEVAYCALVQAECGEVYLNSFCFGFRPFDSASFDAYFLTALIRSSVGREVMKSLAQGSTRYNISKAALKQGWLSMPPVDEQKAIAQVVKDFDSEIDALLTRLSKTRDIKQGMMQQLLTGKVRLV